MIQWFGDASVEKPPQSESSAVVLFCYRAIVLSRARAFVLLCSCALVLSNSRAPVLPCYHALAYYRAPVLPCSRALACYHALALSRCRAVVICYDRAPALSCYCAIVVWCTRATVLSCSCVIHRGSLTGGLLRRRRGGKNVGRTNGSGNRNDGGRTAPSELCLLGSISDEVGGSEQ